ncbi:MAG TPA: VWA domain-containing protein, partial [Thermoanaerobaculia bacterium]|nr:VWA domain-containing protein [Thermoanaerobaculia bacterium]
PFWLLLLLAIAARVALLVRDRRESVGAFSFSSFSLLAPPRGIRLRLAWIPFLLEALTLVLVVVALARPQRITRHAASDRFGIDIVIALDSSGSMAAEDFTPRNRFAVAKDLIGEFIKRRQDDRIGIITFGTSAATRVPITYDRRIAEAILDKAKISEHGPGTAIGQALATAVNRLRTSKTRTRVVILITDGVNTAGAIDPLVAARIAANRGIKVYTIGVGSEGMVPMPVQQQNRFTGEIETFYQQIRGEIDEKTLAAIAETTNGAYFRATDPAAFSEVLRRIDRLEKSRLSAPKQEQVDELYAWPLGAALGALALALLCGETLWLKVPA